jgi:hypothetical protein
MIASTPLIIQWGPLKLGFTRICEPKRVLFTWWQKRNYNSIGCKALSKILKSCSNDRSKRIHSESIKRTFILCPACIWVIFHRPGPVPCLPWNPQLTTILCWPITDDPVLVDINSTFCIRICAPYESHHVSFYILHIWPDKAPVMVSNVIKSWNDIYPSKTCISLYVNLDFWREVQYIDCFTNCIWRFFSCFSSLVYHVTTQSSAIPLQPIHCWFIFIVCIKYLLSTLSNICSALTAAGDPSSRRKRGRSRFILSWKVSRVHQHLLGLIVVDPLHVDSSCPYRIPPPHTPHHHPHLPCSSWDPEHFHSRTLTLNKHSVTYLQGPCV